VLEGIPVEGLVFCRRARAGWKRVELTPRTCSPIMVVEVPLPRPTSQTPPHMATNFVIPMGTRAKHTSQRHADHEGCKAARAEGPEANNAPLRERPGPRKGGQEAWDLRTERTQRTTCLQMVRCLHLKRSPQRSKECCQRKECIHPRLPIP